VTSRLDRIEARLDEQEKKGGVPARTSSVFADILARLDKLEKRLAVAPLPTDESMRAAVPGERLAAPFRQNGQRLWRERNLLPPR
jgi:hypothetical protein